MIEERIALLRKEMKKAGVNAWLITGTDPHQSEYVAARWRTREFITGFTGSAGTVIVTEDKALLWVDSRYFIQGAAEIEGTDIILMKLDTDGTPDPYAWLCGNMPKGSVVGVDGATVSIQQFQKTEQDLKKKGVKLVSTGDLLLPVWKKRPAVPATKVRQMKDEYAGFTANAKINFVRLKMRQLGAQWTFIASIDDIAWLTNLRGDDIPYNPVFVSYLFISSTKAILFIDKKRFSKEILSSISNEFEIRPYEDAVQDLPNLTMRGIGYYSPEKVSYAFAPALLKKRNLTGRDITTDLKARKNPVEMEGMRRAHFLDGVAFANFMANVDPLASYTEIQLSDMFEAERKKMEGYLGPSFGPISGFAEHGAMCHYSATPESDKKVEGQGILVLDTGSQFEFGMTDLTRTLLFGAEATEEQKRDYTLVLKGHLALARQIFPKGTKGVHLDVLARQFLWTATENFMHGTGHGVGCNLNVHEGPMRISPALIDVPLEPGMVISNEPGVYKDGKHGVRIENLIAVQSFTKNEFGEFYNFEVLTIVPYEKKLIDVRYLTDLEISQINAYHQWVHDQLVDYVFEETKPWLEEATSPILKA
ncbi:MAG: aminopeptidase P family protein [Spirochaetales bacterium]|nr:aminopeptidase P family protein [Candidatus Physcosoma equi]